ncbi:hypothetical protein [Acidimangrovimonas sediminis]|uniref:hypothetical protein n=1 Tax=Acidimangrovimonas sediminis TaxID=2056283 RepID=UPI000C8019A6|nr:hypothetical protein [Acidimangrovimonas sediminis]
MYMNKPTLLLAVALAVAPLAIAAEAAVLSGEQKVLASGSYPLTPAGWSTVQTNDLSGHRTAMTDWQVGVQMVAPAPSVGTANTGQAKH